MIKDPSKIITAIVFLLAFDLWGVHAKLLYQLNPDKIGDVTQVFSYVSMNENTITAMLFSLVFAFVPVLVLTTISPKLEQYWVFVSFFAAFDGGAWFIYYNKTAIAHLSIYGAGYYGLFIVFIVASIGFIRMRIDELEKEEKAKKEEFSDISDEFIQETFRKMEATMDIPPHIKETPRTGYENPLLREEKKQFEISKPAIYAKIPNPNPIQGNGQIHKSDDENKVENLKTKIENEPIEQKEEPPKGDSMDSKIIEYLNAGHSGRKIAELLNTTPSTITRRKQKLIKNGQYKQQPGKV